MTAMTAEMAAKLRAPFKPEEVGKLPRIWCGACRDSRSKNCDKHSKVKCPDCRNTITSAHLHLDYVGHAEVTDRFLQADPAWAWEPVAFSANGLPQLDEHGGLWIRLTIAGTTRLGYGSADGKKGPDAVKETIGDALRNAGMRFGVGLDLWGAKFEAESGHTEETQSEPATARVTNGARTSAAVAPLLRAITEALDEAALMKARSQVTAAVNEGQITDTEADKLHTRFGQRRRELQPSGEIPMVTQAQHKHMHVLWRDLGFDGDANRDKRLTITARIVGLDDLTSSATLTFAQAEQVIAALKLRKSKAGAVAS